MSNLIKLCIDFSGGGQLSAQFTKENFNEALENFKRVLGFQTQMLNNPAYKGLLRKRDIRPTRKAHLSLYVGGEKKSLTALENLNIGVKAIKLEEFINALFHDVKHSFDLFIEGKNVADFGYLPPITATRELPVKLEITELSPLSQSIKTDIELEKEAKRNQLKKAKAAYKAAR